MTQTFKLRLICRGGAVFSLTRRFPSEEKALLAAESLLHSEIIDKIDVLISETCLEDDWRVKCTREAPTKPSY